MTGTVPINVHQNANSTIWTELTMHMICKYMLCSTCSAIHSLDIKVMYSLLVPSVNTWLIVKQQMLHFQQNAVIQAIHVIFSFACRPYHE